MRFNFTEIDLYQDLQIQTNETGPQIIRKQGVVQAFIKKFGNAFDDDIELVFPKKVEELVVERFTEPIKETNSTVIESAKIVDITDLIIDENESVDKVYLVKIKKSDLAAAEKISVSWKFTRYLDFKLSEFFVNSIEIDNSYE